MKRMLYSQHIKHTLTWWPLKANAYIAILHACALTFSDFSSKVVFLCLWAAQALQEHRAERRLHVGSPQSDLQRYCIKRTIFITVLHTSLHGEHNPCASSSASPLMLKSFLDTVGEGGGWLVSKTEAYCLAALKGETTESFISLWYVWSEAAWTASLSYKENTTWQFYFNKTLKHRANTQRFPDFSVGTMSSLVIS